jgi:hypothetical protein
LGKGSPPTTVVKERSSRVREAEVHEELAGSESPIIPEPPSFDLTILKKRKRGAELVGRS